MDKNSIAIQVQDTTKQNEILLTKPKLNELGNTLDVGLRKMELGSVRTFQVDSSRLQAPKKVIPVVKTIPFVPQNDSVAQPVYNVFDDNFLFDPSSSFFDGLALTPLEPSLAKDYKITNIDHSINSELVTEVKKPVIDQLTITKKATQRKGFESNDWMLGIIIFSLIVFGWLRVGFGRFVQLAVQASYNFFAARRIKDEANVMRSRVFHFMNLLFFINLALFLAQWIDYQNIYILNLKGIALFGALLLTVILVYSIKGLFLSLLDFFFLTKGAFAYYNATVFIYNRMVGLVLLPIVSVLPFINSHVTPWLLYAGFVVVILLYFFRILRGLLIGFKNRLSIFYLILYLCALEILPLLVLYKMVETYV